MSPPYGDLVLSGVSIRASPNLYILGVKFCSKLTFEDHVRGIVSRVSQRIEILRLVKRIFVDSCTLLRCYFSFVLPIVEYCSRVWGSASRAQGAFGCLALSRVSCCVIDVMWLGSVCCTRLIRTKITVCSASFLLLLEFDILELPRSSSIGV